MLTGFAISISDPTSIYAQAKTLGAATLRVDAVWRDMELSPGVFVLSPALDAQLTAMAGLGLTPLLILCYGNPIYGIGKPTTTAQRRKFARWAKWLVTTLKGRARHFELWNEWETACGGAPAGTADDYMALATVVVPRLRAARPDAIIISAGMSDPATKTAYFQRVLDLGAATLFDGLGIHPYCGCATDTPESRIAQLDALQAQAAGGSLTPVSFYVTEMGWSTYTPRPQGVDENTQAANLSTWAALCATRPWVAGCWTYCLRDQGVGAADKEYNFGVFTNAMQPKQAALQPMA